LLQIHEAAHEFGVFTLDRGGRVVTWNAMAERVCGYAAEEIVGRNFSCFYTLTEAADDRPGRALARAAAEGRCEGQGPRLRRDGSSYWAAVVLTAVYDAAETHCGFACMIRDIGADSGTHQELQSRLSQQEAISKLGARSLEGGSVAELMTQATVVTRAGLGADIAGVLQIDKDGHNLVLTAISDPIPPSFVGTRISGGRESLSGLHAFFERAGDQ
jgi:PAS domain S-box-containing protein